jgi:hypothetical protein
MGFIWILYLKKLKLEKLENLYFNDDEPSYKT